MEGDDWQARDVVDPDHAMDDTGRIGEDFALSGQAAREVGGQGAERAGSVISLVAINAVQIDQTFAHDAVAHCAKFDRIACSPLPREEIACRRERCAEGGFVELAASSHLERSPAAGKTMKNPPPGH
jgi:hypothetical protein